MQDQLFRGLFMSLFALTLTACVGSVTIPPSVVGTTKKAVEYVNPCTDNPFGDTCLVYAYRGKREAICAEEPNSVRCAPTIARVCGHYAFNPICTGAEAYYSEQYAGCTGYRIDSKRCIPTIARVCGADAFDLLCEKKFNNARETICANEKNSTRCAPTIVRVCTADSLNVLCDGNANYYLARKIACAGEPFSTRCAPTTFNSVRETACMDEPNSVRCRPTITRVCETNMFDALCTGAIIYHPAQKTACANEPNSERCAPTITRVCKRNIFDALCTGAIAYYPAHEKACAGESDSERCTLIFTAQKTACADEPNSPRCAPTLDRVCEMNLFDELCQLSTLKRRHFPAPPNANFDSKTRNRCDGDHNVLGECYGYIPNIINIKPLNGTNTGMATYTGTINIAHPILIGVVYEGNGSNGRSTENISINVNFDDKTLSSSGGFDPTLDYFTRSVTHSNLFTMDGSFTDRGMLTGTFNFRGKDAPLIGLIGQTDVIGVFATKERTSSSRNLPFAGGFTATRE